LFEVLKGEEEIAFRNQILPRMRPMFRDSHILVLSAYFDQRNAAQKMSYLDPDEIKQLAGFGANLAEQAKAAQIELAKMPTRKGRRD
jgi:hypothetical protein